MICSSMKRTQFSRWPGKQRYSRSSKNTGILRGYLRLHGRAHPPSALSGTYPGAAEWTMSGMYAGDELHRNSNYRYFASVLGQLGRLLLPR